jgi:hypothetical protein
VTTEKEKPACYRLKTPCAACPWRKDVPVGKFPPERFIRLQNTVQQGFNPVFACHQSPEGKEAVCAGYLLVDGDQNFAVRIAAIEGRFKPRELSSPYPLYGSYTEMAVANGCSPRRRSLRFPIDLTEEET